MKRFNNISLYRLIATLCILQFHIFYILFARAIPYEMLLSKGVQGLTALSGFLYSQKLITDNIKGEKSANETHYKVGSKVRQTIQELGGTMPENLPTPEKSLKELEKENKRNIEYKA